MSGFLKSITQKLPQYIPLYRGAGKRGFNEIKSTEGGVFGDGVYFYTDPLPARSHATTGGGVIVGYASPEDLSIQGNIAVLKDPSKFVLTGKIPVEDTLSTGAEWVQKTEKALSQGIPAYTGYKPLLPLIGAGALGATLAPQQAQAENWRGYQNKEPALQEPIIDPTTLLAGPARWGGGLMNLVANTGLNAIMGKLR